MIIGRRWILALATTFVLAAVGATAEVSRIHKIALEWFVSHNSGEAETMRSFTAEHRSASALEKRPLDQRVQRRMGMFGQVGVIEPHDVISETENVIVIRGRAEKVGMWLQCTFTFEAAPPHKLDEIVIQPTSGPDDAAAKIDEWGSSAGLLEKMLEKTKVPAIAVAVVDGDDIVDVAAVGVRAVGGEPVTVDDLWHIGSVTKSITATMIAELVEAGMLEWSATLGDALGDIEMRDEYRDVTLENLLHHRGGIQPYTILDAEDEKRLAKLAGNETEVRAAFALEVLQREPVNPRGQYEYSNAGYTLAALMAELATGRAWTEMVREYVFAPTGVEVADFGWPATPERPQQPRGHFLEGDDLRAQELDEYQLGDYLDPAGDVCMSIADLARYARMHLQGLRGRDGALAASTIAWLHTDPDSSALTRYAAGWVIRDDPELGEVHWHNGSAGTFYAAVAIHPGRNRAVVAASNGGIQRGQAAVEEILGLLAGGDDDE